MLTHVNVQRTAWNAVAQAVAYNCKTVGLKFSPEFQSASPQIRDNPHFSQHLLQSDAFAVTGIPFKAVNRQNVPAAASSAVWNGGNKIARKVCSEISVVVIPPAFCGSIAHNFWAATLLSLHPGAHLITREHTRAHRRPR